ncbi:MAG: MBL fold metallo-hydrolase [Actinobacteria bacterium]|nr:MBL fold metallo-hydrolase [Actinomycetota bacterium]
MTLEVVVLGCSGSHPGPGRACSGYLVRSERTQVVLDCGNGSTSNLFRVTDLADVDAVVLSHRHPDHCVDMIGLYYALKFDPAGDRRLDVHAPAGTREFLAQLVDDEDTFGRILRFHEAVPGGVLEVGDLQLTFHDSPHAVPTVAIRAEHHDGVVAYSADSGGGPGVVDAARDADLFLCEATWLGDPADYPQGLHLTARGAGALAAAALARRLALVHLWPANSREQAREEAQQAYSAPVHVAEDLDVYQVGGD